MDSSDSKKRAWMAAGHNVVLLGTCVRPVQRPRAQIRVAALKTAIVLVMRTVIQLALVALLDALRAQTTNRMVPKQTSTVVVDGAILALWVRSAPWTLIAGVFSALTWILQAPHQTFSALAAATGRSMGWRQMLTVELQHVASHARKGNSAIAPTTVRLVPAASSAKLPSVVWMLMSKRVGT